MREAKFILTFWLVTWAILAVIYMIHVVYA